MYTTKMAESIPKMSPQYVASMITFKTHLLKLNEDIKSKQTSHHNRSKTQVINEQKLSNNYQSPRQKKTNNYISCIDKIYGKMFREREELENILNQFDQLQQHKQTILNTQQKQIKEEIIRIKKKKKAENNLMEKIAKDFQKEIKKDPDQLVKEYKLSQRLHRKVSNQVVDEIFNKKSDLIRNSSSDLRTKIYTSDHGSLNSSITLLRLEEPQIKLKRRILEFEENDNNKNFFDALKQIQENKNVKINTYRERVLEAFKNLPPHLQTDHINITQKQRLEKLKVSLHQARGLLSERKSRQAVFRTHLDHEKRYLEEEQSNYIKPNQENNDEIRNSVVPIKLFASSQQGFMTSENRSPREVAATLFTQLNENCNEEDLNCRKVIKLFKRKQKGFVRIYQDIKNTHAKYAT